MPAVSVYKHPWHEDGSQGGNQVLRRLLKSNAISFPTIEPQLENHLGTSDILGTAFKCSALQGQLLRLLGTLAPYHTPK